MQLHTMNRIKLLQWISFFFRCVWRKLNFECGKWKKFEIKLSDFFPFNPFVINACLHLYTNEDDLTLIMKSTLFCIRIVMIIVTTHILHAARYSTQFMAAFFYVMKSNCRRHFIISFYMNFVIRWRVKSKKDIFLCIR